MSDLYLKAVSCESTIIFPFFISENSAIAKWYHIALAGTRNSKVPLREMLQWFLGYYEKNNKN